MYVTPGFALNRAHSLLNGTQTRQKLKEAYDAEFTATIERAEKQIILAKHGRRLLNLLDDTPVVPGDNRLPYEHGPQARQILNDAEDDLKDWRPDPDAFATPGQSPSPSLKAKDKEVLDVGERQSILAETDVYDTTAPATTTAI